MSVHWKVSLLILCGHFWVIRPTAAFEITRYEAVDGKGGLTLLCQTDEKYGDVILNLAPAAGYSDLTATHA